MRSKYPKLSEMPYYRTKVSEEKTKFEIVSLLEKYGIADHQWTKIGGQEYIKFIFATSVQGKEIKVAVQFDIPQIRAIHGRYNEVVDVPRSQIYRIFYYSLKSLLETTQYGIMKKEDLFFSYILTQLPNGQEGRMKDFLTNSNLLLPQESGVDFTYND